LPQSRRRLAASAAKGPVTPGLNITTLSNLKGSSTDDKQPTLGAKFRDGPEVTSLRRASMTNKAPRFPRNACKLFGIGV
jgi:hypothetical protein